MKLGHTGLGAGLLAIVIATTGCSNLSESLGFSRRTPPDEFQVVTNAPLSVPPEFALRPPAPGETGPGTTTPQAQARAAVTGGAATGDGSRTVGENALLAETGAGEADPSIRQTVDRESQILAEEGTGTALANFLLFWRDPPPAGTTLDARGEAQRIRENRAAGRPITEGETPIIERSSEGGIRLF